jgi:hypothetical protein
MDTLDTVELVQQVNDVVKLSTVVPQKKILPVRLPSAPRAPREKWCSTLDAQSLRCLLSVLETSVIPQLIGGYSPAVIAPLPVSDSMA